MKGGLLSTYQLINYIIINNEYFCHCLCKCGIVKMKITERGLVLFSSSIVSAIVLFLFSTNGVEVGLLGRTIQ